MGNNEERFCNLFLRCLDEETGKDFRIIKKLDERATLKMPDFLYRDREYKHIVHAYLVRTRENEVAKLY